MNMKRKRNSGFTLIELLVVVLIIGILAAIAIPQYFRIVEKSRAAGEVRSIMGDMRTAQAIFRPATGNFTTNLALLDLELPRTGNTINGRYFNATITAAGGATWAMTFTRLAGAPSKYGAYTVAVSYNANTGQYTGPTGSGVSNELFQ